VDIQAGQSLFRPCHTNRLVPTEIATSLYIKLTLPAPTLSSHHPNMRVHSIPRRPTGHAFLLLLCILLSAFSFTAVTATIVKTNNQGNSNFNFNNNNTVLRYQDTVSANSLGDPLTGASSCTPGRPIRSTFVCDASALLSPRSANRIDAEIRSIYTAQGRYKRALCNGRQMSYGYLIEVAVVRRMNTGPNSASAFASTLYSSWKVGESHTTCGNGVLILISLEDRKYFFAAGNTVRRIMQRSSSSNKVERALVKYLRQNNVYMAVLNAVMVLGNELAHNTRGGASYGAPPPYVPPNNNYPPSYGNGYGNRDKEAWSAW